jgi:superfamily II DNA or RNA helicase
MNVHVAPRPKLPGPGYDDALRSIRTAAGLSEDRDANGNRAHILSCLTDALEDHGRRPAWPHQVEAIGAVGKHFLGGGESAICVIPTAGGKTEIFQRLVAAAHRNAGPRDLRTVVLVPTRQLIVQTVDRFRSEFPWLHVGFVGKDLGERWAPVTVMTYARFVSMSSRGRIRPGEFDLLVMDEAHRGLSDLRQGHFRRFIGTALIAAFSATPVFDVNKNVYQLLGSGNEVIHVTIVRLIAERRIAPVLNVIVGVNLVGDMPDDPDTLSRVLKAASVRAMLDVRAAQAFPELRFALSDRSFVAYAFDIEHGVGGAAAFNAEAGREGARAVSYLTDADEQRIALEDLSERRIDGVFNAMVFLEGTDIPTLGAVYNLAPTTSLVRQMQRSGRALRLDPSLDPADPRQTGVVVDFFYRINGRMLGRPVFYCDAIGDRTIARAIETAPLDVTPLLVAVEGEAHAAVPDAEALRLAALARQSVAGAPEAAGDCVDEDDDEPGAESIGEGPDNARSDAPADAETFPTGAHPGVMRTEDILARLGRVRVVAEVMDVVSISQERDRVRFGQAEEGLTGRTDIAIRLGVSFDTPAVRGLFDGIEAEVQPLFRNDPRATVSVVRDGVSLDVCYRRVGFASYPQYRVDQFGLSGNLG